MTQTPLERATEAVVTELWGLNFDFESERDAAIRICRKVLEAIREPSDAMLEAAKAHDIQAEHSPDAERICWQAMIDAALDEKQFDNPA